MGRYLSTKKFDNYSVAIRQYRAAHSHCELLHGYAVEFKCWFEPAHETDNEGLDDMNWVVDFGGFKPSPKGNGLKTWMDNMWDHTLLLEASDPHRDIFEQLGVMGIAKPIFLEKMGAESCARLTLEKMNLVLAKTDGGRCRCVKVECNENKKNSGIYETTIEEILANEDIST